MKQAKTIQVAFFGPTDTKGSRFRATSDGGSVTVGYDHAISERENKAVAAQTLADKLGWGAVVAGGELKGKNYFFCETGGDYNRGEL